MPAMCRPRDQQPLVDMQPKQEISAQQVGCYCDMGQPIPTYTSIERTQLTAARPAQRSGRDQLEDTNTTAGFPWG